MVSSREPLASLEAYPFIEEPMCLLGPPESGLAMDKPLHLEDLVDVLRRGQTGDVRWSPADELRLLVAHGTLHLCGRDHAEPAEEAAMRALERDLLGR